MTPAKANHDSHSMTQFLCTKCSCPAWFYLDGGMLCPDHAALHVMAGVKDMVEQEVRGRAAANVAAAVSIPNEIIEILNPSVPLVADGKSAVPFLAPGPGAAGTLQNPFLHESSDINHHQ